MIFAAFWCASTRVGNAPAGCILNSVTAFGGPISLLDQNGHAFTQANLSSGASVVYFGYTHCPDVCPTTLYALGQALASSKGHSIQPVFITVDPERDTPELLRSYVATGGFPAGLVGLTGSADQIRAAAQAFHVVYRKAPIEGANADTYNMDHTSLLYVMDAQWKTRGVMTTVGQTPQTIAACIRAALGSHA